MRARRAARALALLGAVWLAPSAGAAEHWHTLEHDLTPRSYRVDVPDGLNTRGAPLLIALHGGGGSAETMARQSGLSPLAARAGFVVAYPNGSGRRRGRLLTWNSGGGCCGRAQEQAVDDVGFLRAMIQTITDEYGTDPRRVYLTGLSNGAMLAYRMACEAADLVAGIAPVAGAPHVSCYPSKPVAVIAFHGTADDNVPYAGGVGRTRLDRDREPDPPVADTLAFWAQRNRCGPAPQRELLANGTVQHDVWPGCARAVPVELYTVVGGGHAWPGGERISALPDAPATALSASERMLEFFSRR